MGRILNQKKVVDELNKDKEMPNNADSGHRLTLKKSLLKSHVDNREVYQLIQKQMHDG